jgi:hypothetical protein
MVYAIKEEFKYILQLQRIYEISCANKVVHLYSVKAYGGVEFQLPAFLMSALDGCEWSDSSSCCCTTPLPFWRKESHFM